MQNHSTWVRSSLEGLHDQHAVLFEALAPSKKAKILFDIAEGTDKKLLFFTSEGLEESRLFHDLSFFFSEENISSFSAVDILSSDEKQLSYESLAQRKEALSLALQKKKNPSILLISLQASLQRMQNPREEKKKSLKKGEKIPLHTLVSLLESAGFHKTPLVEERGQYAVRGEIVDFFPLEGDYPIRLELFDDLIESIRTFDPGLQRSIAPCDEVHFSTCTSESSPMVSLFSLFPPQSTYLVFHDLEALEDRYVALLQQHSLSRPQSLSFEEWFQSVSLYPKLFFSDTPVTMLSDVRMEPIRKGVTDARQKIQFSLFNRSWDVYRLQQPYQLLRDWYESESFFQSPPVKEQFVDCFMEHQETIAHTIVSSREQDLEWFHSRLRERGGVILPKTSFQKGTLSEGLIHVDAKSAYLTLHEILERATLPIRSNRHSAYTVSQTEAFELVPGECVVHYHHGIGRFLGIETKKNIHGLDQEFFVLSYESESKLYVPFTQAHLLTKYIGRAEEIPKLHQLGSVKWKKQREMTEKAIVGYAADLLKSYAARTLKGGFSYPADSEFMARFEADFPYTETEDQLKAIDDVRKDMCSGKAMDRLICGDVGYGKTEVAMRAAFKAVIDGKKQVAVLVPTTVLAMQHYDTFKERMEAYGIRVGQTSRFVKPKENKKNLEKLAKGEIDILIGTHKILSKNVLFYDLGLVIVDEEQRFGVKAKEYLKLLKEGVDCLTLSATPIPRTLYFSLAGARDLSTINTPPYDRVPIKTIVGEADDTVLQQALLRELNRGGQIFYIHNRIESLQEIAEKLRKLVPHARLVVGHGQMGADALDAVFHAFQNGQADILLSTSIIENGIDIPNANTIIIDRADRFGMAELYQLRGRVGRWNRRAFAYFLLPKHALSEMAKKRIEALAKAGGWGGGFRVAMRDLELRGAGDILGTEQSGNVSSIGFHLYCKLLKKAMEALQGKGSLSFIETKVEIPFDARLEAHYIEDEAYRIDVYYRLGEADSLKAVDTIREELIDRFGKLPTAAEWLFSLSKVRYLASQKGITLIRLEKYTLSIESKKGEKVCSQKVIVSPLATPKAFEKKLFELLT
jgi:transcription-repair coupling factor (superfamily II helicase)